MKPNELGDGPRIKAALALLDETATSYERRWGIDKLDFYEDAATVAQRRTAPNFKKSFEGAVRR